MSHLNYRVTERLISIDEIIQEHNNGSLKECFGTGTAAVVAPVGKLAYKNNEYVINNAEVGTVSQTAYDNLVNIQKGNAADPFNWVVKI